MHSGQNKGWRFVTGHTTELEVKKNGFLVLRILFLRALHSRDRKTGSSAGSEFIITTQQQLQETSPSKGNVLIKQSFWKGSSASWELRLWAALAYFPTVFTEYCHCHKATSFCAESALPEQTCVWYINPSGKGPGQRCCFLNEYKRNLCREERKKNTGQKNKDEKAGKKDESTTWITKWKVRNRFVILVCTSTPPPPPPKANHLILLISFSSLVYNLPNRNSINNSLLLKVLWSYKMLINKDEIEI